MSTGGLLTAVTLQYSQEKLALQRKAVQLEDQLKVKKSFANVSLMDACMRAGECVCFRDDISH